MKIIIRQNKQKMPVKKKIKLEPNNPTVRNNLFTKSDLKEILCALKNHCWHRCQLLYDRGNCPKMGCYKLMRKIETELETL